jgi:hypothetical protein
MERPTRKQDCEEPAAPLSLPVENLEAPAHQEDAMVEDFGQPQHDPFR